MSKFVAKKKFIAIYALALVLLTATVGIGVYDFGVKSGSIRVDGQVIEAKTNLDTVEEILEEKEVQLGEHDSVEPALDTELEREFEIEIERAQPVVLTVAGETKEIMTVSKSVGEVLDSEEIYYDDMDRVSPDLDQEITPHLEISVVRVSESVKTVETDIEYGVEERENSNLERGKKNTIQEGEVGKKKTTIKEVYENQELVKTEELEVEVTKEPVTKIVEVGTKAPVVDTSGSNTGTVVTRNNSGRIVSLAPERSGAISGNGILVRATAYDDSPEQNGGYAGLTAMGTRLRPGVIAVDRNVIPLGTEVYIEYADGTPFGYAVAEDVGGAIRGNKIDIYMDRHKVSEFGVKQMRVYILR